MRTNGVVASTLFTMLCLGGIAALCSQSSLKVPYSEARLDPSGRSRSADPGDSEAPILDALVPATLERGARIHVGTTAENPAEPRLRLR